MRPMFDGVQLQQDLSALPVLKKIIRSYRITLIIELGTGFGGIANFFSQLATTHTYEIKDRREKIYPNINYHIADIFESETKKEIISLIQGNDRVFLFCDNGNKVREFKTFAPYIKDGDLIFVHDWKSKKNQPEYYSEAIAKNHLVVVEKKLCDKMKTRLQGWAKVRPKHLYPKKEFDDMIVRPPDIHVPYTAKKWIENWLQPRHCGVEFGSGFSTIWLSQRIKSLVSVEHDVRWKEVVETLIEKHKIKNVEFIFEPNTKLYLDIIKDNKTFDFIFIDGIERLECMKKYYTRINKNGVIFMDNTDSDKPGYKEAFDFMNTKKDWDRIDFRGLGINPRNGKEKILGKFSVWKRIEKNAERYEINFLDLETLDPSYSGNVVGHLKVLERYDSGDLTNIEPFEYYEEFHILRESMRKLKREGKSYVWDQTYMAQVQLVTLYERMKEDGYGGGAFSNNFMWAGKRKDGTLRPHGSHRTACLIHMYRNKHPKAERYIMVCVDKDRKDKLGEE